MIEPCWFCDTEREPLLTHECEPGARADTNLCRTCFEEFGGDRDGDGREFVLDDDTKPCYKADATEGTNGS